ncbi:MAG: DUF4960 domain-containing protein [Bacteroidales bacterium]|nr:DUF4960 domain-containing protein [Candidatus Liminaster caballi]
MNTLYKYIVGALLFTPFLTACDDSNVSNLSLSGDCKVEALTLNDNLEGQINLANRTIKVKVPVDFTDKSGMTVSKLEISKGAKANMAQGDVVDFSAPKVMHVTNGDVFLDWTVNVKNDEAKIYSFILDGTYKGSVNEAEHTVTFYLPGTVDVTKLVPTITVSEDAQISPRSGVVTDFSSPVVYTVTDNTAVSTYTVKVEVVSKPKAIFLGSEKAMVLDELCGEEQEACKWMLSNISNSLFVSWSDLINGNVDLSDCEVVWWHWQHAPSENITDFESGASATAMKALNTLMTYYKNGGSFILSRAAVNFAAELGAVKDKRCANNCWGASDDGGEVIGGPWDFPVADPSCWMWENIIGFEDGKVKTLDAGYKISNCVSQWGMWGDYGDGHDKWAELTGCKMLAHGWDGAITIWECPAASGEFGKGGVICFGSGCYDWYSPEPYEVNFERNVGIMTGNAFNYLMK